MTDFRRRVALLDSNILASMVLTDIFVQLAVNDVFQAKWTDEIHREWMAAVLKFRPSLKPQQLERRRRQMDAKTREALVIGYEVLIAELTLPDANDRHVLAAAIHGQCDVIVTKNLKDFPAAVLAQHRIEAQHPDTFLLGHLGRSPLQVCAAMREVIRRAQNPPYNIADFLARLSNEDLRETAAELAQYAYLLD